MNHTPAFFTLLLLAAMGARCSGSEGPACHYEASHRSLTVLLDGRERFTYVFNKGGAINGIFDLQIAPGQNLIGPSFQGESTDRVIQWTYWNWRYEVPGNPVGDHDKRANVTMEGSFGEVATCDAILAPESGTNLLLRFKSRVQHWFYANLDQYGKPDFETSSTYEVLNDGSLKLWRSVTRHPWRLTHINEMHWNSSTWLATPGSCWLATPRAETMMVCENLQHGSQTSYFEAWSPFDHRPLPLQKHGKGTFGDDGYRFWKPQDLGGWAMAYGDKQAVAMVFGKSEMGDPVHKLQVSFNKLDQPQANLSLLLPAVEASWPDDATLTQVLIIVPGAPADVERRATALADTVPVPTMIDAK